MIEAYLSLFGFMILMVGTPGPANLLAMLGGSQIGLKSCSGFLLGLAVGKIPLNILIGFGFGVILSENTTLFQIFKYISAVYMIYLASRSWNTKPVNSDNIQQSHQFDFKHGVIVHPLNPKAWVMSALAWSNFAPAIGSFPTQLVSVVFGFAVCQLTLTSLWCWGGSILGRSLPNNQKLMRSMIILTILVVLWAISS